MSLETTLMPRCLVSAGANKLVSRKGHWRHTLHGPVATFGITFENA